MDTRTDFDRLLARFEDMTRRCERMNKELSTERERNDRLARANRELAGLERKLEEWVEYGDHLHGLLSKRLQQLTQGQRPKPLEAEIPF